MGKWGKCLLKNGVSAMWKRGKVFAEVWCFSNVKNRENDMKREKRMKGMNDEMLLEDGEMSWSEGSNAFKMKLGSACGEIFFPW